MTGAIPSIQLQLELNSQPAPAALMQALQGIRVQRGDRAPSTFELQFHSERLRSSTDFSGMAETLLAPFSRVTLMVTVAAQTNVLIDGFIASRSLQPGADPMGTRLIVQGEDVSLRMNLFQISLDYPMASDFAIVAEVLARYAVLKVVPDIAVSGASTTPHAFAPMQNGTDRDFLGQLAQKYGYRFYILPGSPTAGSNTAYWGPPNEHSPPQKSLVADGGPGANVESIELSNNGLAPTVTYGAVSQDLLPSPAPQMVPILAFASERDPLATDPGLASYSSLAREVLFDPLAALRDLAELNVRGTLLQPQSQGGLQGQEPYPLESQFIAQGLTDESTDPVVVVRGTLLAERYGQVLDAPGIVPLRGVGASFDGLYYLRQVLHDMALTPGGWHYSQSFTLTRGGVGSTISKVSQ